MAKKQVHITLPAHLQYSAAVRCIADEVFGMAQLNKAWRSRLKLVVDELFMNAVNYGSRENISQVRLQFEYDEDGVSFQVEDEGQGPHPMKAEDLQSIMARNSHDSSVTKTSGRGLGMITHLWTDSMTIAPGDHGGIRITCSKKREDTVPPPMPMPALDLASAIETPVVTAQEGPQTEVKLSGNLDQTNMDSQMNPVYAASQTLKAGEVLVLDLEGVTYINSTFIGHLARLYNTLKSKNAILKLKRPNPAVKDVLDLVGFTAIAPLLP